MLLALEDDGKVAVRQTVSAVPRQRKKTAAPPAIRSIKVMQSNVAPSIVEAILHHIDSVVAQHPANAISNGKLPRVEDDVVKRIALVALDQVKNQKVSE